jgi:hypothetical protein
MVDEAVCTGDKESTKNDKIFCSNGVYKVACILKTPKINTGRGIEAKTISVEKVAPKINLLALKVGAERKADDIPE